MAGWKQNLSVMKEGGGGNETGFMVLVYECWLVGWRGRSSDVLNCWRNHG